MSLERFFTNKLPTPDLRMLGSLLTFEIRHGFPPIVSKFKTSRALSPIYVYVSFSFDLYSEMFLIC